MQFDDEEFFEANTANTNRLVSRILFFMNFLPWLFFILSKFDIFNIENSFSMKMAVFIGVFSIIDCFLVFDLGSKRRQSKRFFTFVQHFAKYFGLIGTSIIISVLGTNIHIGIYISYALVAFMSCLYYSKRTAVTISIICYIVMIASLFERSLAREAEGMAFRPAMVEWIAYSLGFTIEFFFVFLITYSIAQRLHKTLNHAMEKNEQLRNTQLEIMEFIPKILESHEVFTGHHVKHTVRYVELIARELKRCGFYADILTEKAIVMYSSAANLHDIGKIHIPDNILNKPGKFEPEEFSMMKSHPSEGKRLLESLPRIRYGEFNKIAMQMAYCHHEKYDGSGYPLGLSGNDIPLCARIMTAADVLDALLSWRPYKEPFSIDTVIGIFENCRGTHFEPCIADAVISLKPQIALESENFKQREISDEEKEYRWRHRIIK